MPTAQTDMAALVARMPDTDDPGKESTFTGLDPREAAKAFEEILAGGAERVAELIRLMRVCTDADFKDFRAEYVLHGLVVYAGHPERDAQRRLVAGVLASHVGRSDLSKGVRACLIRELQCIGGPEVVEAISGQVDDEDLSSDAITALVAIGPSAAEALRRSLPRARGRNRLSIVQALGVLRDRAASGLLEEAAGDENRDVRIAAVWALAAIGSAGSTRVLLKAADTQEGWERIQAARSCLLLAEKLLSGGKKTEAAAIYSHLQETRQDPGEQHVREAASRGLAAAR